MYLMLFGKFKKWNIAGAGARER